MKLTATGHFILLNLTIFIVMLSGCAMAQPDHASKQTVQAIQKRLTTSNSKDILIISHRGDWRNAPENSLQAIRNCIAMGIDIVEIDIQKTKDWIAPPPAKDAFRIGHLILSRHYIFAMV
jgi:hypothetical protein